jgi:hypothetical protein
MSSAVYNVQSRWSRCPFMFFISRSEIKYIIDPSSMKKVWTEDRAVFGLTSLLGEEQAEKNMPMIPIVTSPLHVLLI